MGVDNAMKHRHPHAEIRERHEAILAAGAKRIEYIGDAVLIQGDCLNILPALCKVDSVVTDPPYGVGFNYSSFEDTPANVAKVAVEAIRLALGIARSVAVTPGTECAFLYPKPNDIGAIFNASGNGSGRWGFKCSTPVLFYGKCPYLATSQGRRANSWQQSPSDVSEKCGHPCPKPLGMMRWLVNRASLDAETILDPFMGSGTTGVAALQLGRQFIGIELHEEYFDIACKRIAEAWNQPRLFDEPKAEPLKNGNLFSEGAA